MGPGAPEKQSTNGTQTTTSSPWAALAPYLKQSMSEAQRLYSLGPQKYTPWGQVAGFNGTQLGAMKGIRDYVNSAATQNMLGMQTDAVNGLLNGGNNIQGQLGGQYAGNLAGYLSNNNQADPSGSLNRFMYQDTTDPSLLNNVNGAVQQASKAFADLPSTGIQNRYGIRDAVMTGLADQNTKNTINSMLGAAYNNQEAMRNNAIGLANQSQAHKMGLLSNTINQGDAYNLAAKQLGQNYYNQALNSPLSLLKALGGVGDMQQQMDQAQLNDATNRFNFDQQSTWDALNKYYKGLNVNPAWGTQTTNTTGTQLGAGAPKSNMLGGILGGGMSGAASGAALGGALAGATAGSSIPIVGTIIGGLLGAASGYMGSQ